MSYFSYFLVKVGNCLRLISIFLAWHIFLLLPWKHIHYTCNSVLCIKEYWLIGEKCCVMKDF